MELSQDHVHTDRVHQRREFVVIEEAVGISASSHQGFNLLYIPVMGGVE